MILRLSQSNVGDALGVTFQQVQKYERGANRISASRLAALAGLMKVRPEFFFENETGESPTFGVLPDYLTEFLATADGIALIRAFQKLKTRRLKRRVLILVQELAEREKP